MTRPAYGIAWTALVDAAEALGGTVHLVPDAWPDHWSGCFHQRSRAFWIAERGTRENCRRLTVLMTETMERETRNV